MKKLILSIAILAIVVSMSGCATPYMMDRRRDLADIATVTLGKGFGAGVRAGPAHIGLLGSIDHVGLRGGAFRTKWSQDSDFGWAGIFDPLIAFPGGDGLFTGGEWFRAPFDGSMIAEERGKLYEVEGIAPFVMTPQRESPSDSNPAYYFTQLEAGFGLGLSIRLGLNPGELTDFLLGWFGIDIYSDDIESKRKQGIEQTGSGYPPQGVGSPDP